jgi:hypothetical protein
MGKSVGAAAPTGKEADAAAGLRATGDVAAEREAIRRVHLALLARLEQHDFAAATELFADPGEAHGLKSMHTAYRQDSRQQMDAIAISEDGAQATARFHVEAEVCTPIEGDCTAAQMARLQGNVASRHWESGRFEVKYSKTQGDWKIVSFRYERAW